MKFNYKLSKKASYIILTNSKFKNTILHQIGHVFKRFESGLSHKQHESTGRPEIEVIAVSFIRVNLKGLLEFPLGIKE